MCAPKGGHTFFRKNALFFHASETFLHIHQFIPQMEENIAKVLGIDTSCVNVKATTTEKLGFEGEGLGISAYAVCTITEK